MPKQLTMGEIAEMARQHGAGEAWEALTPAGRREWAARVRKLHAAAEAERRKEEAAALKKRDKALDRFMAQFAMKDPSPSARTPRRPTSGKARSPR